MSQLENTASFLYIGTTVQTPRSLQLLLILTCIVRAHSQIPVGAQTDTTRTDTTARKFIVPIPLVGSLDRRLEPWDIIGDSSVNFIDYRSAGDLINLFPGIFIREFGSPGPLPDVTRDGLNLRRIGYYSDGIRLNDPFTGTFNPYLIPSENIDRLEMPPATESYLYGLNSASSVNILSKSKKAIHPYSRLRYDETADGYALVDGMVSQDIIRGLNVTMGAQHNTFGPKFPNSDYDHWNARIKARYNLGDLNFYLAEVYNQTQLGLNGGIDLKLTPDSARFEKLQAFVRNTDSYEKITRHDVHIGAAYRSDSNTVTTATIYFSSNLREFRDEENRPSPNGIFIQQDQQSHRSGVKLAHHREVGNQILDIGVQVENQRVLVTPATDERTAALTGAYGKLELSPAPLLRLIPSARLENFIGQNQLSYGGRAIFSPDSIVELFGGYSRSYRFPTFEERYGLDTLLTSTLNDESLERLDAVEIGSRWRFSGVWLDARAFRHSILDPIVVKRDTAGRYTFAQQEKEVFQGFSASSAVRLGSFFLEGKVQYTERVNDDDQALIFPKWTATGGFYYWDKLFEDHLNLKTGIRAKYFSDYTGREFNQQALVYVPGGQEFDIQATGTIDFLLIARLGDAYVHFIWENLTDEQYVMTSFYPMPQREIRFGVSWEFTD